MGTNERAHYPRLVESRLLETLDDTPVVLIHGPRQCGKTTLARDIGKQRDYAYFTLDDDNVLEYAVDDPVGFVERCPERTILDEVQRAPGLFRAIKATVDRDRTPGRFLLAGSTNVLLVPKLADSLAGRLGIQRLHPLAQCELTGSNPEFLDRLFSGNFDSSSSSDRLGEQLVERILSGGYPEAIARRTPQRRAAWYRDYIETIVQRDVRDLTRIESLDALPRLLSLAAGQTARLINVSDLASPFQLSRPTIKNYLTLLERVFLLERLSPWHSNQISQLIKTPKLHLGDTGVASSLLELDSESIHFDRETLGQLLETFVYQELRRQASGHTNQHRFHHYRDKSRAEVDVVIDRGPRLAGIEVKAGATIKSADFRGLRKLESELGERFAAGIVLHDGERTVQYGDKIFAVPFWELW